MQDCFSFCLVLLFLMVTYFEVVTMICMVKKIISNKICYFSLQNLSACVQVVFFRQSIQYLITLHSAKKI